MKKINFNEESRECLKKGVNEIAKAVSVTLGAKGRNVILRKGEGYPITTKDGVTVAKHFGTQNRMEDAAAKIICEAAQKTDKDVGDGTTTTIVLASAIVSEGLKNITAGANPMDLKRGIDKAVKSIVKEISEQALDISGDFKRYNQIAFVSSNGDKDVSEITSKAIEQVGEDGNVILSMSGYRKTTLEVINGFKLNVGYFNEYFINTNFGKTDIENAKILITDKTISDINEIFPIVEQAAKNNVPLFIIAESMDGEAITTIVKNTGRGGCKIGLIRAPGYKENRSEILEDIAMMTGATAIFESKGLHLKDASFDMLGEAERIICSNEETSIIGGKGDKKLIDARIAMLNSLVDSQKTEFRKKELSDRVSMMSGKTAKIDIGGIIGTEIKEKYFRFEDAIGAVKSSLSEGIVVGGGKSYINAINSLDNLKLDNQDEKTGVEIVKKAIKAPFLKIIENSGQNGEVVLADVLKSNSSSTGFNVQTGVFEDFLVSGIIDPAKASRTALENAASAACALITTECIIDEETKS